MKRTVLPLSLLIIVLWAVLQPAGVLDFSQSYFPLRKAYTTLTGALALGWMGVSMLLALRPAWLERSLGGSTSSTTCISGWVSARCCWSSRTGC